MRRRASIKGIKGTRSETKGHNAVSVNCDAGIKGTVTSGEKETVSRGREKERAKKKEKKRDG